MIDLNRLHVLSQVLQHGSFTLAAAKLGVPKSSVSRQIARLEDELGTQLFRRTTRKLHPTEAALKLGRSFEQAAHHIHEAESEILENRQGLRGLLRVTAPVEFGASLLQACLPKFMEDHPELEIELDLSDRFVDLIREGFDVAIRAGELADSSLKARKIGQDGFQLVASPSFVKKHGEPKVPEDLKRFPCLRSSIVHPNSVWEFFSGNKRAKITVPAKLAINNFLVIKEWVVAGQGIALIPSFLCRDELKARKLLPLLTGWRSEEEASPIHAVYPAQRFVPPKVQAFIEFLVRDLSPIL